MNPAFWEGKRVFVTGHTGFKGSWLCLWLQSLGAHVTGYALQPPTSPSLFVEADVGAGMKSVIGDVRDLSALSSAMREADPQVVIHMAAQPLVRYSYDDPVGTYATNVMGTVNLLEAVRGSANVRCVVNVTTDKCYENREWMWGYREIDALGGFDPYSNSKACSELVTDGYRSSFFAASSGPAIASARAGNVIGGGDWARDRLVPDAVTAFLAGHAVQLRNPSSTRPWQHVLEPLRGYLSLAERLFTEGQAFAAGWNFGPNDEDVRPVSWIVERLAVHWGNDAKWSVSEGNHPHEAGILKLDISKARSRLGWHPHLRLDDALKLIVDWAQRRREGEDVRELTLSQITQYQKGAILLPVPGEVIRRS
ncbi:CDP-glucose 4,6-dehydratase [Paraburkholderia xenovorans]|uniref:CDP-glucose 4,6-dehydratase n=1 Tax=Paraburkholderia xenovorans TaxID=36873 RepID=UPI0038B95E08